MIGIMERKGRPTIVTEQTIALVEKRQFVEIEKQVENRISQPVSFWQWMPMRTPERSRTSATVA